MQTASSRIWTWVAVPISYGNNHYSTNVSFTYIFCDTDPIKYFMAIL